MICQWQSNTGDETILKATPVANGTDQEPDEDEPTEQAADESCKEASEEDSGVAENDLDKRKSPELPLPELDMPAPNVPCGDSGESGKGTNTDDEGQLTPSGTLSRHTHLDELVLRNFGSNRTFNAKYTSTVKFQKVHVLFCNSCKRMNWFDLVKIENWSYKWIH